MQTRRRVRAAVFTGASVAGLLGAVVAAPAAQGAPITVTDRGGDTVTDAVEDAIAAPAADIVGTSADSRPDGITLAFRVSKLADPLVDLNWSTGGLTTATWMLDTNGDSKSDYVIDYYVDEETKVLTADLDRVGPGHPPEECMPKPGYSGEAGYSVVVDPKCLGGASALSYQVELVYTTDVKDDAADVATDVSPDTGWAGPVTVSIPAGAAPVPLVPPVQITVPPSGDRAPNAGAPETPGGSPSTARTNPAAKPIAPQQATSAPRPSAAGPATAPGTAAAPNLAHTGAGEQMVRMAWFATGIILIGFGLLFANRRVSLG